MQPMDTYRGYVSERIAGLSPESQTAFSHVALDEALAAAMVENQLSEVELPLGVVGLCVDGTRHAVPMATEEASVIAACAAGVKMLGNFTSTVDSRIMRGQIAFSKVEAPEVIAELVSGRRAEIFAIARESYPSIVARGGGLFDVVCRPLGQGFVSVDFLINACDAMGANIVDSIVEGVAAAFRQWLPGENLLFGIVSNYTTECLTRVRCAVPLRQLGGPDHGRVRGERVQAATEFAKRDIYRAVTHNKGILNGIEAVALATGNDTRAINAACHAYAARSGSYEPLSEWRVEGEELVGSLELPLAIATKGGATGLLPKAKAALELVAAADARTLSAITASVGLAQNFAALRALTNEGIQRGHMALRARAVSESTDRTEGRA